MNRPLTVVFSALEALLVVGVGLGLALVPLTLMWGFQYGLQLDWAIFWRASVDIWMLGHGGTLTVALDEATAAALGFAQASTPFVVGLAPLGIGLLTLLLGRRAGRRIAETPYAPLGLAVATLVFAGLALVLMLTAVHPLARPSIVQGTVLPALVFAAGLALGATPVRRRRPAGTRPDVLDRLGEWLADRVVPPRRVRAVLGSALVGGTAAAAAVLLVASVVVAVLVAGNYGAIIALYEGAHAGVLGGVVLTLAQLAFVPNLVVWGAAWLVGPGFAVGVGSAVSPLGTSLGPIPAIPVLGALPTGSLAWGFLGLLVPVVAGFLIGVVVRPRLARGLEVTGGADAAVAASLRPIGWPMLVACGGLIGLVAGAVLAVLAAVSGGPAGPGRLVLVGPDPWAVLLWATLEVGVAAVLGLLVASRPARG